MLYDFPELKVRDGQREVTHYWSGDLGGFAISSGAYKGTFGDVRFSANDYTVPASKG
jgi:hypothetical protein